MAGSKGTRSAPSQRRDNFQRWRTAYTQALIQGDSQASQGVISELLTRHCTLGEIHAQVIAPALVSVGDLWCRNEISVAEEHLATQLVVSHLDRLSGLFAWRDRLLSYGILTACVEGERHWLGARMFADLCSSHGWSVEFLGPDVPDKALLEFVRKRQPQILALSATMATGMDHVRAVVRSLATAAKPPKIILGGQALPEGEGRVLDQRCVIARDAAEGVEIALNFLRANRPKAVLKDYLAALGRRVRDLRLKKGWTQEQLARGARVTRVCIVAVEGGKQNVSMDIVIRLANALAVAPAILMSETAGAEQE